MEVKRQAAFFLSVDVPRPLEPSSFVASLYDTIRNYQIRGLWSFEFQGCGRIVENVSASANDCGLLADGAWAGADCERTGFARELAVRLQCADEMGIKPVAFTFSANDSPNYFDLLVKYQLAIIRTRTDRVPAAPQALHPRLARYGIWEAEPTVVLPAISRWSFPWTARRQIQQAIDGQQLIHVAVNATALSHIGSSGLRSLDRVLRLVSARRDAGVLRVVLARELLEMCCPRRERLSARSVLRAA